MARLQDQYKAEIVPKLKEKFGYRNVMQVPRLVQGRREHGARRRDRKRQGDRDRRRTRSASSPARSPWSPRRARASRTSSSAKGVPIGVMVTLRRDRMYHFLDKLIAIALPRVRDFKGRFPEGVRRAGQLHPRGQGADHLPRDQLRQDRQDPGHEHHHRHHRPDRRRRPGAAAAHGNAVPGVRGRERRTDVGQEIDHRQVETDAEIRRPEIQPVSALRQAARFLPEVPALPDLPEAARPSRASFPA